MNAQTLHSTTSLNFVERVARDVVPVLGANASLTSSSGRVAEASLEALSAAGIYGMSRPRAFGGFESPLTEQVEILSELARGCGSTAWVVSTGVFSSWLAGQFSDQAQAEVFAEPNTRLCGSFTPSGMLERTAGGYVVNGSWGFNTGCLHAHWDFLTGRLTKEDGSVEVIACMIPLSDLTVEINWEVEGLAGTGSNTTIARNVFVPDHRTMLMSDVISGRMQSRANLSSVFFKAPALPTMLAVCSPVAVGIGRAGLEMFLGRLPGRPILYTAHSRQSEAQLTHLQVAEARTKIDLAELLSRRTARLVEDKASAGRDIPLVDRAQIRSDTGYAVRLAREAMEIINAASGASSIRKDVPFRRVFLDIQAMALHALLNANSNMEIYGRMLVGLDPANSLL